MAEGVKEGVDAASPPKRKTLFTKSTWTKPAAQKEGIEFFSRADELWPTRVAEEERRRQKKAIKLERKRSTASAERKPLSTPDSKRRRVSRNEDERHSSNGSVNHDEPDEAFWARRQSTLSTPGSLKSNCSPHHKQQAAPASLPERYSTELHSKGQSGKKAEEKDFISLDDSDDEDAQRNSKRAARPMSLGDNGEDQDLVTITSKSAIPTEEDAILSDEEFPELARQARERAKQKELESLKTGQSLQNTEVDTFGPSIRSNVTDDFFEESPVTQKDHVVEILVTSVIEGTNPLRVRRKLSQNLREVRLVWCDKQSISGERLPNHTKEKIFLTWKGKKLFDLTTCKSLGLKIDGSGHIISDGEGFTERKIHLEAWTPELYELSQRKLKAKKEGGNSEDDLEVVEQVEEQQMRLTMQAKGMKPYKITASSTTTFSTMAFTFRKDRAIPEGQDITLFFDGDRLNPDSKVEDVELDEMDNIEVHIR